MKFLKLIYFFIFFCSFSFASEKNISCYIEAPCGWLYPIPGVFEKSLGYCLNAINGNSSAVNVSKSDEKGNLLSPIVLQVQFISQERIAAVSQDNLVSLNVSKYDDFLAGGLLVKTEDAPDGLGFFTSCEIK